MLLRLLPRSVATGSFVEHRTRSARRSHVVRSRVTVSHETDDASAAASATAKDVAPRFRTPSGHPFRGRNTQDRRARISESHARFDRSGLPTKQSPHSADQHGARQLLVVTYRAHLGRATAMSSPRDTNDTYSVVAVGDDDAAAAYSSFPSTKITATLAGRHNAAEAVCAPPPPPTRTHPI